MKLFLPLIFLLLSCLCSNAQVVSKVSDYNPVNSVAFSVNNKIVLASNGKFFVGDGRSPLIQVTGGPQNLSFPVAYNNRLYFSSNNVIYVTDGTDTGTHYISNTQSLLGNFTVCNGQIFYETADYNIAKINLATLEYTVLYDKGLPPFNNIYAVGNEVYFTADDGVNGGGLWKSDGSVAGTVLVKSIPSANPNYYSNYGLYMYTSVGNKLVFGFNSTDLWVSDGTAAGTVKIANATPLNGKALKDKYYYTKSSPTSAQYTSLWVTDGTLAGSHMVKDSIFIQPGESVVLDDKIICILNNQLAVNGAVNPQLGILNPNSDTITTFASFARDLFPVKFFSEGRDSFNKKEVFFIASDSVHGAELWITDGTAGNTRMVKDIMPGEKSSFDRLHYGVMSGTTHNELASYYYTQSGIYFAATDSIHGMELWQSDGTENGTMLMKDINPAADSYTSGPEGFFGSGNLVFFHAVYSGDISQSQPSALYVITADSTALPVTLSSFAARAVKNDVAVTWKTATEQNTAFFKVQRSADGGQFTDVGTVQAAGNSTVARQYAYLDADALNTHANILYYRLQTNDKDGKLYYSAIVPIKVNVSAVTANVYPNPATDFVILSYNLQGSSKATVRITDAGGKQVLLKQLSNTGNGQTNVDVRALAAGVYYIQVITAKGVQTTRFVKQ